jgi:Zn-dependent peptidase ImmA (M78 family)/DNA-binding XRE family transcriptional regulator
MADIISTRISQMRVLSGLSKTDLARQLEVSPSAVSQWESGDKHPSLEKLLSVSKALGVAPSLLQAPIAESLHISGPVSFRAKAAAAKTRAAQDRAKTLATLTAEVYAELTRHVKLPSVALPDLSTAGGQTAADLAEETRARWGLGSRPILRLAELLESKGVLLAEVQFGDLRFDAFSCRVDEFAFVFLGSDKGDRARRRFDAAHELGHLILHRRLSQEDFDAPETFRRAEDEANAFSSAFLLPRESFLDDLRRIGSVTLADLLRLKARWGVSAQAMIRRARDLGFIHQTHYENLCKAVAMRKWRGARQEPGDETIPDLTPSVGARAIKLLHESGTLSKWQLRDQLPMPNLIWAAVGGAEATEPRPEGNVIQFPSREMAIF